MPKSVIFTRPFLSSRIFSGLMSRWTMPSSCANCSASQICGTMASASFGRKPARPLQLAQVRAVHKFHDEKLQSARLAKIMHGDDVGMDQPGQRARFAVEPLGKTRAARGLRRQDFQRHQPVQRRLARLIDRAHAALANEVQ